MKVLTLNYSTFSEMIKEIQGFDSWSELEKMRKNSKFTCYDSCLWIGENETLSSVLKTAMVSVKTNTFGYSRQEVLDYMKRRLKKFDEVIIFDVEQNGMVTLKASEPDRFIFSSMEMSVEDSELRRVYGMGKNDDEYKVNCTSCGDGGCVHCEPHRFM